MPRLGIIIGICPSGRIAQYYIIQEYSGGETGIRTLGTREGSTVFETAPFDHSGTSPRGSGGAACKGEPAAVQEGFSTSLEKAIFSFVWPHISPRLYL